MSSAAPFRWPTTYPDMMLYGGYSRGYKAGGFNLDRQGLALRPDTTSAATLNINQTHFDPEFTDAYEVGLKSTILGGTTTLNLAAFYQQIHDYQLNAFNGFNYITRNVPEVISQGAELEFSSSPMEGLTISGGVSYIDAYFDSEVRFSPLDRRARGKRSQCCIRGRSVGAFPRVDGHRSDCLHRCLSAPTCVRCSTWTAVGTANIGLKRSGATRSVAQTTKHSRFSTDVLESAPKMSVGRLSSGAAT
jgi:outer membrane receptor protein involved in Fe transport